MCPDGRTRYEILKHCYSSQQRAAVLSPPLPVVPHFPCSPASSDPFMVQGHSTAFRDPVLASGWLALWSSHSLRTLLTPPCGC